LTKNKNLILEVEDLTGKIKLIVSFNKKEVYEKAENLSLDSVLGFKCSGNKEILFVNDIIFPGANLSLKKKSQKGECALFIGDLHYGSKNFLEQDFLNFIDYLNKEEVDPEVAKIKYLFIVGDLVTGVGNYPDQEKDLNVQDLEKQFQGLANLLSKIRKDIKIIISPGNHDGVRLMEPQPLFDEKYAWPLYEMENVVAINNPSYVNISSDIDFSGFDVLVYHGFSYPFYASNVSKLMQERAMNSPEKIMEYLLINRHLAPTHSSVQYYPCEKDNHLIRKIPDIFVSGHTHKSGISYYNNILLVSVSSWESMTPYQEKFGNEPDHCKVLMVNLKTRAIKILDFENLGKKENKTIREEENENK
jgi:DNA polymerase II small subunit